ncbi:hypothetical protein GBA52_018745 [Prunus armeniaca]|nr:hypothetical protein GBA52_018745 [Prunus armeniaca]
MTLRASEVLPSCVCAFQCLQPLCVFTMSAQLNACASRNNNTNLVVVNKGRFTFRVDRNEIRFSTSTLASSVQKNHFENYCLNRPWFVQGQIFALKRWSPKFSPFHATVDSIVSWVRIPFLPLHYRDEDVLRDLVSILGTPIQVDEESLVGRQGMNFIQVERLENEHVVYPTDMVLDEALQHQLSEEIILVFPQRTLASSHTGPEFTGEREADTYQLDEDNDLGWTVVANRKGKGKMSVRDGRSFKEDAK